MGSQRWETIILRLNDTFKIFFKYESMNSILFYYKLKGNRSHIIIRIICLKLRQLSYEFQVCLLLRLYFNFFSLSFLFSKMGLRVLFYRVIMRLTGNVVYIWTCNLLTNSNQDVFKWNLWNGNYYFFILIAFWSCCCLEPSSSPKIYCIITCLWYTYIWPGLDLVWDEEQIFVHLANITSKFLEEGEMWACCQPEMVFN